MGSRLDRPLNSPRRTAPAIERQPRGTPGYERKLAGLSDHDRLTVELVEDSIVADRNRTHARRTLEDGTEFDLTAYDEWNVLVSFERLEDGTPWFLDFKIYEPN